MMPSIRRWWSCAVLTAILLGATTALAEDTAKPPVPLLQPAQAHLHIRSAQQRFPGAVRASSVAIDLRALRKIERGDALMLNLFDEVALIADIDLKRTTMRGSTQWRERGCCSRRPMPMLLTALPAEPACYQVSMLRDTGSTLLETRFAATLATVV